MINTKRWRIMEKGHGYSGGNRPWWPHVCGAIGYRADGGVVCYVDLVVFRRIYYRVFEIDAPSFEIAVNSSRMNRIGTEMKNATPCP